jgi:hypothetical protein
MSNSGTATAWNVPLLINNLRLTGSGSATLSNGGAGQSLVSSTSVPPALATKSLTAGAGITLTPTATDITISSSGAGTGNMNYVGAGTVVGQHYNANDITGLNATNSSMIESATLFSFGSKSLGSINKIAQNPVAIGSNAGITAQTTGAVAIGSGAGQTSQATNTVAIGSNAGNSTQGVSSVAIGSGAGQTTQGVSSVAIGGGAGQTSQGVSSVAIGGSAGTTSQGVSSVAIGSSAGTTSQGASSVAIGGSAGTATQGAGCVAIGSATGNSGQKAGAVAIGVNAGNAIQGLDAIAIGRSAGSSSQGDNAIAIGELAGQTSQSANSIILNATGVALNATTAGLFIDPVRILSTQTPVGTLKYSTSKEIYYDTATLGTGNMNYVDSGTVAGQHYMAQSTNGTDVINSALIEDANRVSYNGKRIQMGNLVSPVPGDYAIFMKSIDNTVGDQAGIFMDDMKCPVGGTDTVTGLDMINFTGEIVKGTSARDATSRQFIGHYINNCNATNDGYASFSINISGDTQGVGHYIESITSASGIVYGYWGQTLTGRNNTYGMRLDTVQSNTAEAFGSYINEVFGETNACGSFVTRVVANNNIAYGNYIFDIESPLSDTYGILIDDVKAPSQKAFGLYISNITGATTYGIYQSGSLTEGNRLDAQTEVGSTAPAGGSPSMNIVGGMKTSVQRTSTTPFTITKNGGNTVISSFTGGASSIVMPSMSLLFGTEDGLTFNIFHRGTGAITISGSGGQLINGAATFNFPAASGYTSMTILWDGSVSPPQWFAHVN